MDTFSQTRKEEEPGLRLKVEPLAQRKHFPARMASKCERSREAGWKN